jgi:hypothetical protein
MTQPTRFALLASLLALGCDPVGGPADGGLPDARVADGGPAIDGGTAIDAGPVPDGAAPIDASLVEPDAGPPGACTTIERHGVTFELEGPHPCGRFVNGDWWVLPAGGASMVAVRAVSPAPTGTRNGAEVDPEPGSAQAFDDRANGFDATRAARFPLALEAGRSLVATASSPDATDCTDGGGRGGWTSPDGDCRRSGYVYTAAVLTALAEAPPFDAFRPSPTPGEEPFRRLSQLDRSLLGTHAIPEGTTVPALAPLVARLEVVRLDHKQGWTAEQIQPVTAFGGYGADVTSRLSLVAVLLHSDLPAAEKEPLLVAYVQAAIDLHGIHRAGGIWPADGGHGSGRKLPILFAGALLGDADMLSIGGNPGAFQEDCQTYHDDAGMPRWGIRHCQDPMRADWSDESSPYRLAANSEVWVGQALVARWMRLEVAWGHQPFFDYVDRYRTSEGGGLRGHPYITAMWAAHRDAIDTCTNGVEDRCELRCVLADGTIEGETGIDEGGGCP